jgi:flagellar hook assembly protein FlgD
LPENDSLCIAVSTLVSIVNNAKNILFSVFPNPTTGKVYYGIDLDADAEVEIKVYDLSGRLVKLEKAGTLTKGKHSIETNNETLAEGTYFFVLKAGDQSYNGRFVIVK